MSANNTNGLENYSSTTKPLDSIAELLEWKSSTLDPKYKAQQISGIVEPKSLDEPQFLVCHDLAGNYNEDRFCDGCPCPYPYYFTQWYYVDIFVYFSHSFVTIPPYTWTTAGHKNGVLVLGTFITEFDQGAKICREILSNKSTIDLICNQLVNLCIAHGFDGWLLNIENHVDLDHIANLAYFVGNLTKLCKSKIGLHSKVIWYDSVTIAGNLKWQDELNELNEMFFLLCDGIFLNYCWKQEHLERSVKFLDKIPARQKSQVFVGIDVFGRGCFGGGQFKCNLALEEIRKFKLSIAMFAQAWTYQNLGAEQFEQNDFKFWYLLRNIMTCRPVHSFPIDIKFNPGKYRLKNGEFDGVVFDLCNQSLQPHIHCNQFESQVVMYTMTSQFENGVALTIRKENNKPCLRVRLFCCDLKPAEFKGHVDLKVEHMDNSFYINLWLGTDRRYPITFRSIPSKLAYFKGHFKVETVDHNEPNWKFIDLEINFGRNESIDLFEFRLELI